MRKRLLAGASAAAVGAASAITALVIGTTAGWAADTTSSAWGASATGQVPFSPTPYIESTDGSTQKSSSGELPKNDYISAGVINLMAGNDTASTNVADISLLGGVIPKALQDQISAVTDQLKKGCDTLAGSAPSLPTGTSLSDLLKTLPDQTAPLPDLLGTLTDQLDPQKLCDALKSGTPELLGLSAITVSCKGDTGKMDLGDLTVLGQKIDLPDIKPNMDLLPDNPLLKITADKQVKNDDGSFSVTGLAIDIAGGQEKINLAGVTCGKPQAKAEPTSSKKSAPKPAPVTTDLPVTG